MARDKESSGRAETNPAVAVAVVVVAVESEVPEPYKKCVAP